MRNNVCNLLLLAGLMAGSHAGVGAAGTPGVSLVASTEAGWPQWRGPRRDGISLEAGLLKSWPEGGPRLLWAVTNIGNGYSCPIVAGGKIFITGDVGEHLQIFAFDPAGRPLWAATNGASWNGQYPGARACVAYSEGRLYHLNAHGRVACVSAEDGRELWAVDVLERFGGKNITWALSECLVVESNRVYVTPGGERALMAALDKRTGQTVWASEPLRFVPRAGGDNAGAGERADPAGYTSPILIRMGGRRQLVNCSQAHAFGVDADTGKLLWTHPMPTLYKVLACTPAVHEGAVFVTGPDSPGGTLLRLEAQPDKVGVTPLWVSKLDTCHGGVVFLDDRLIGSWYRGRKGWACLSAKTGDVLYQNNELAKGSLLYADGLLYTLCENGVMALLRAGSDQFEVVSQFKFAARHKNDVWAHPVILDGRLYLRYHERLACFDIRATP